VEIATTLKHVGGTW